MTDNIGAIKNNAFSVVCDDDAAHRVQEHLKRNRERDARCTLASATVLVLKQAAFDQNSLTLSIDRGPSVLRIISATALAAAMFPICACRPCVLWVLESA